MKVDFVVTVKSLMDRRGDLKLGPILGFHYSNSVINFNDCGLYYVEGNGCIIDVFDFIDHDGIGNNRLNFHDPHYHIDIHNILSIVRFYRT